MEEISIKRIIEPFVYFPKHASAIPGLGGPHRGPDPNYCFHTHYFGYLPGEVRVHITFRKARATTGELSIRIHGYRPENQQLGIKLMAAERVRLEGLAGEDHTVVIRFASIPGVHYAAYGYFSAPSDLRADGIDMIAEELGGDDIENYQEAHAPPTMLTTSELIGVNALVTTNPAQLRFPNSQACTVGQIQSTEFGELWPQVGTHDDPVERWRQLYLLQVLEVFGFLQSGGRVLAVGPVPELVLKIFEDRGCQLLQILPGGGEEDDQLPSTLGHFDMVVCLNAMTASASWSTLTSFIDHATRRLTNGGLAVLMLDYSAVPESRGEGTDGLSRPDIERLALRLISHGYDIAQLKFPSERQTDAPVRAIVPFGLVVRR
ncbi:hypothetical protein Sphch_2698 [Sphingobium chlorophenolicum L-1]|uniref:Class I SAM-dependent methyltransferase n=1 Tax=Sphingobium chlorophenolicum L-1 TaxID=690566 RepID=F6F0L9_SPHCR|nr:hypothetical protein [Sphingobium chlorophenolicum]AEG50341.1 hypothetical protein Sphch_2698 [Sphingobium chlorophenolicum L-1]